jgi:glutathione S-transferase
MIRLYHCPETRSMRVLWLLHELRLPFELIEMPFELSATRSPDYLAIHPLGRVPCLVEDGRTLFESGAITEYLCERFPEPGLGRLQGNPERYEWLQWIHYSETIAVHAAALVQQVHFIKPEERSPAVSRLEGRRLQKAIEVIDSHLGKREYLLQSGFSAADIGIGYSLHLAYRFVALERFAHVESYYDRLRERPAFIASLPKNWRRPLSWLAEDITPI